MDLIIRYADALFLREMREMSYRTYMSNILKGAFNVDGDTWHDIAYRDYTSHEEAPEKTADDILMGIMERGGLVAKHGLTRPDS